MWIILRTAVPRRRPDLGQGSETVTLEAVTAATHLLSRCFVWLVRTFAPRRAESLDACLRTLPPKNTGHRLLDLGCGDGSYARMAQAAGWKVTGLENDPAACRAARSLGVSVVEAAFPPAPLPDGSFDVVRLHHVIEHLHDPRAALREIFRLLAPGGLAMVTTPNLGAYGLEIFGRDWRGLEPPRHLVLFTPAILNKLLRELGFAGIGPATSGNVSFYFHYSYALATGFVANVRPSCRSGNQTASGHRDHRSATVPRH